MKKRMVNCPQCRTVFSVESFQGMDIQGLLNAANRMYQIILQNDFESIPDTGGPLWISSQDKFEFLNASAEFRKWGICEKL